MSSRVLQVCGPNGVVKPIPFDKRPLAEQVQDVCDAFGLAYDRDDSYSLLTQDDSPDSLPIRSEADLLALPEHTQIGLHTGADVAQARLSAVQSASAAAVARELQNLSMAMHTDAGLAEEVVDREGIRVILEASGRHVSTSGMDSIEPAAVCLCELLRYDVTADWLDERQEELLDVAFFGKLFSTLFPANQDTGEQWDNAKRPPRASLSVLVFLLNRFPKCAAAAHETAEGPVYKQMVEVIAHSADEDEFQVSAALSVLCAMFRAAECEPLLLQRVRSCLLLNAGEHEELLTDIFTRDWRDERYAEQLLLMCMDSCTELAAERTGGERCDGLLQEVQRLRQKLERDKNTESILRNELRRLHRAMRAMVGFLKIDRCLMVEKQLPAIIKNGWDSIQWNYGYSLLHFVCECLDDPKIVELVGALAPDLERPDDKGKRPIDYARENKCPDVAAMLEKLRRRQQMQAQIMLAQVALPPTRTTTVQAQDTIDAVAAKDVAVPLSILRERYEKLEGVPAKVKQSIEVVLTKGWGNITWPKGFNALHASAMHGHAGAVELLAAAKADLNSKDDFGYSPIDYASKNNYKDVVAALDKLITARASKESLKTEKVTDATGSTPSAARRRATTAPAAEQEQLAGSLSSLPEGLREQMRQMCDVVLNRGWDKIQWKQNFTGLHQAASAGSAETVKFLLQAKASVALEIRDDAGLTPLDYARKHSHQNVIALLTGSSGDHRLAVAADPDLQTPAQPSSTLDATTARSHQQRRDEHEMNIDEVRAELDRLKAENLQLLDERQKRESSLPALTTFVKEDEVLKYVKELQSFGNEAVHEKLQEDRLSGGLALAEQDARRVTKQLELIGRICTELSAKMPASTAPTSTIAEAQEMQPPVKKGEGKGKKGKAPAAAPPPSKGKGAGKASGKDDGLQVKPRKTKVTTRVAMKPIWLTRFLMGTHFQAGETIWSSVEDAIELVPKDELEERFAKNANSCVVADASNQQEAAKKEKILRIITDPRLIGGKEAAMKKFESADAAAQAIIDLDETVLTVDGLSSLRDHACPSPDQVEQLKKAREADPDLPLALPEQFMWRISQIPAYKARLDCWLFVRTFEDRVVHLIEGLQRFAVIVDAARNSRALVSFLGLILAFANYCNGGTDRGQADGFDLSGIRTLEGVKDPSGKDLRQLIFHVYFTKMKPQAEQLFVELRPLFDNIVRSFTKDSDGAEKLSKKVDVTLEDYDKEVTTLNLEYETNASHMRMLLQFIEDPADHFKLQMPALLERAEQHIKELVVRRNDIKERYGSLLKWLRISAMNSNDFCCLWDDLFVPETLCIGKPAKFKKEFLIPSLCQSPGHPNFEPLGLESLLVLWGFQRAQTKKDSEPRIPTSQRSGRTARRRNTGGRNPVAVRSGGGNWNKARRSVRNALAVTAAVAAIKRNSLREPSAEEEAGN